jgi:hypothetical protein
VRWSKEDNKDRRHGIARQCGMARRREHQQRDVYTTRGCVGAVCEMPAGPGAFAHASYAGGDASG